MELRVSGKKRELIERDFELNFTHKIDMFTGRVIFFPINAPGMGRFQLLNLWVLGYGLELRFWEVIVIIVSLTLTITLITTLTII